MTRTWKTENLDCAHCTSEIERKLALQTGVKAARLNFMAKRLTVESEEDQGHQFWEKIEDVAKSASPTLVLQSLDTKNSHTWAVSGLDCASCASKVERSIATMDGVSFVSLDFMRKKLTVKTVDTMISTFWKEVEAVAKKAEPSLVLHSEEKHAPTKASPWINRNLARLVLSFTLLLVGFLVGNPRLSMLFIIASYLVSGYDVLAKAGTNILRGRVFDENFLMSIASLGAMAIGQFSEGAAVMLFYQTGEFFQSAAVDTSRRSISEAMNLKSEFARLVSENNSVVEKVAPEEVSVGARIRVLNGEKVPLDGILLEGSTSLDTKSLTGESVPRFVEEGAVLLSGSVNLGSVIDIEVTKPYSESTVSKIMALVEDASSHKAPTEQFITSFARYYTPIVVALAAMIAIIPTLIVGGFSTWLYRALVFLVISCPCALVISVPLAYFAGIGKSAKGGLLVKGGNYLEALSKLDTMVFDKTGTLTKGEFSVVSVTLSEESPVSESEGIRLIAILEKSSNHPIAQALASYGKAEENVHAQAVTELSGRGIVGTVEGRSVVAGNALLLQERGVALPSARGEKRENFDSFESLDSSESSVLLAVDGQFVAQFVVEDTPKDGAKEALRQLKALGIRRTVMLSGDSHAVAERIARSLGLDEFQGGLLPGDKVEAFAKLERESQHTAFVGDGINDAPTLARAKVGIAMGAGGSDAAIEAADIVIMTDDILAIPMSLRIARKTKRIVLQNISFALGVKVVTLVLGALGLATMWWAVFADVGVAFLAILNSLRILLGNASR
ncbi:MAG TPA: heavy metal translocating P-type ATPase [Sphaerochaeta sp.]|nr:heavy metal translocating P-type ATPase [Sphaerochaeta sp.]